MKKTIVALFPLILLAVSPVAFAAECPLCDAAYDGNLSEVKILIDNGANVNATNENGWTSLIIASEYGQSEVAKLLLGNGANVNYENKGWTALMIAAQEDQSKVAKVLLDHGANANYEDKDGWTALMIAAKEGQSKVTKVLLENGANVDHKLEKKEIDEKEALLEAITGQNGWGWTALMMAVSEGHGEVAKVLLGCGANPDITDGLGRNAWELAKGKRIMSAILEKHFNDVVHGGKTFSSCNKTAAN